MHSIGRSEIMQMKLVEKPCAQGGVMDGDRAQKRYVRVPSRAGETLWTVAFALMLAPFFELRGLNYIVSPVWGEMYFGWRIASTIAISILFLLAGKKRGFSWLAIAVSLSVLISTIINTGIGTSWTLWQWLLDWAPLALGAMLMSVAVGQSLTAFLRAVTIVTGIIVVANLAFVLVWPTGIWVQSALEGFTLIGNKNLAVFLVLLGTSSSLVLGLMRDRKAILAACTIYISGLLQCGIYYSATSMTALVLFGLIMLVFRSAKLRAAVNGLSIGIAYVFVFCSIVLFRLQNNLSLLIEGVLGKSLTFTGRTAVWDGVISMTDGEHILFGYGTAPRFHLEFDNFVYNHPHNDILSVLLSGGIVALVLYLMLVGWALGILYKNRTELLSHIFCAALAGFFAVALMEPLFSIAWGVALGMAYYAPYALMERGGCESEFRFIGQ